MTLTVTAYVNSPGRYDKVSVARPCKSQKERATLLPAMAKTLQNQAGQPLNRVYWSYDSGRGGHYDVK